MQAHAEQNMAVTALSVQAGPDLRSSQQMQHHHSVAAHALGQFSCAVRLQSMLTQGSAGIRAVVNPALQASDS